MTKTTFSHIALVCKDSIKIEDFYTKYFGFKRTRVYAPGPDQVVMIKLDNIYFELFKAKEDSPVLPPTKAGQEYPGWRHVCFSVDNIDEKLSELKDVVKITLGPTDMSEFIPNMRVVWITDPEGNIIELNQGYKDDTNLL